MLWCFHVLSVVLQTGLSNMKPHSNKQNRYIKEQYKYWPENQFCTVTLIFWRCTIFLVLIILDTVF